MKKLILFMILLVVQSSICLAGREPDEKIVFEDGPKISYLKGNFSTDSTANPGDIILLYFYRLNEEGFPNSIEKQYKYLGRTGDKTYEIEHTFVVNEPAFPPLRIKAKKDEKKDILKMYFDKVELVHCKDFDGVVKTSGKNCTADDKIFIKVKTLKGNTLEYKIVLPDCLKATQPKN